MGRWLTKDPLLVSDLITIRIAPDAAGKTAPIRPRRTTKRVAAAKPKGMGCNANSEQAPAWCFNRGGKSVTLVKKGQGLKLNKRSFGHGSSSWIIGHGHTTQWQ